MTTWGANFKHCRVKGVVFCLVFLLKNIYIAFEIFANGIYRKKGTCVLHSQ